MRGINRVGMTLDQVATPALYVDLDVLNRNIGLMAAVARRGGVAVRPHAKAHKCPAIAHRQIQAGATGICCQKLSEAEVMADAGISDILLTYQLVGADVLRRMTELARRIQLTLIADDPAVVAEYGRAAVSAGTSVDVLIDLCPGGTRTGVDPGRSALALAQIVAGTPGVRFAGLQAYNGAAQHVRDASERQSIVSAYVDEIARTRDLLMLHGLVCKIISGSGTGTVGLEAGTGIFTEVQPGSYIFMDVDYSQNIASQTDITFGQSLFVNARVISRVRPGYAMIDSGTKSISVDSGMPGLVDHPDWSVRLTGDEHGVISWSDGQEGLQLGDSVRIIPGHCDPTVNLHDEILAISDARVVDIWPVLARGALW